MDAELQANEQIVWAPQSGPQEALVHCPITLVGYGGARGGGKTDGVLGKFAIKQEQLGADFNAIFFRKELPQADDLIERAKQIYLPLRAHWQDQKKQFTFPQGGRLRFRPLANDADAEKYQGQNLSDCAIEEAGNYSDPSCIWKLFGALRGKGGGQILLTFNPGGVGHGWLKELFIKPAPKGMKVLQKLLPNGASFDYIYIPSRVHDNQILLARDPEYINRLHMVGSPELVRAWLEGDFEIHEGSYFPEFSSKHIVAPFNVPQHWPRYMGYDWGYRSPFAAIWGAVSSGRDDRGNEVPYPKGAIIIYREMWGKGVDNIDQANRIGSVSVGENPLAFADPSIFNHEGGPSIADQFTTVFAKYKFPSFRAADNERVSGWSQIRQRLVANPPMLYIFATCPYLLETLPSLSIDKRNPEDADSTGNDHACLTGDTLVITDSGAIPIKELCGDFSVFVLSHDGNYQEACGALTRKQAAVMRVTFDDDTSVVCTFEHKFMLPDGTFEKAAFLYPGRLIRCVTYASNSYFRNDPRVQRRKVLPLWKLLLFSAKAFSWLKAITQKGLGILQRRHSERDAHSSQRPESSQQSNRKLRIVKLKDSFESAHDARAMCTSSQEHNQKCCANGEVMAPKFAGSGMALGACSQSCEKHAVHNQGLRLLRNGVSDKKTHGQEKPVLSPELQNERTTKAVKSISYSEAPQDVYCLNVPATSTFVLANGVVSHNCDALRYLCKGRLIDAKWEQPAEVFNKGKIKLQAYIAQMRSQQKRAKI
jgi:hypothetical protein